MGDNLASSSEDEKSPVGSKGPRRSDDDPAAAEALRDDMTIAGSIVGSQSEAGDALTAEAEPTAAATEPPANPAEPTASSEVGPEPITEPADAAGSTAPTSPVESEGPEPIAATEVEAGSGEEGESQQSKAWKVITPNPEVTVIEKVRTWAVETSSAASTPVKLVPKQPDHPPPGHVPGPKTPPVPPPKTPPMRSASAPAAPKHPTSSTASKDTTGVAAIEPSVPR